MKMSRNMKLAHHLIREQMSQKITVEALAVTQAMSVEAAGAKRRRKRRKRKSETPLTNRSYLT
jgi:anti-sigma factor RsiW